MITTVPFDRVAKEYDTAFTFSETGQLQRKHVRNYLEKNILNHGLIDILEINCGTGEDAIWLNLKGHSVLATDISGEMINVARMKIKPSENQNIDFRQLSFTDLLQLELTGKFDLVFSNFGGLNCIGKEDLQQVFSNIIQILKPGGRFIGVIMPRYCLWEMIYYSYKSQRKKIFRRAKKGSSDVNLSGETVKTWYYSPGQIRDLAKDYHLIKIKPIGILLPPSFLENFFRKRKRLLKTLDSIDYFLEKMPFLASCSDHFLFDFTRNS